MKLSKDELSEIVEELKSYKGRQTELITVYISAGYEAVSVQKQLEAEQSTAKNIKSTSTRKNVTEALEKIVRHLKEFKKTPENGLAVFCGNISKVEGQDDLRLWSIEPPMPLKVRLYRCDKEFVLEPLEEQLKASEIYGLLVMDRKEATIGVLEGKRIEIIQKMTSGVPSKVRAGGQCLSPDTVVETKKEIKRIKDVKIGDLIKAFNINSKKIIFTKCLNKWQKEKTNYREIVLKSYLPIIASFDHLFFVDENKKIIEKLTKNLFKNNSLITSFEGKLMPVKIKEILDIDEKLKMIDIETEEGNFFANGILVHNSSQRFHRITEGLTKDFYKRIAGEMKKEFFENHKLKGIIIGGPIPTKDEFLEGEYLPTQLQAKVIGKIDLGGSDESGIKELVAKSHDILSKQEIIREKKLLEKFFETLGQNPEKAAYKEDKIRKAIQYGAVDTLFLSKGLDKQLLNELKKLGETIGSKVEIISTETEEGKQFLNVSGTGAILRFSV